jgi:hypothetical protein
MRFFGAPPPRNEAFAPRQGAFARRVAASALAAGCLLAAGCDYWKNLVDGKTADKAASLSVTVRDLFTKDTLRASCVDSRMGFSDSSGNEAVINRPEAPTGRYSLRCNAVDSAYYEGRLDFDVMPGDSKKVVVELARKGGKYWYEDNRPFLYIDNALYRVPETFFLRALPAPGGDSLYRYDWSVKRRGELKRNTKSPYYSIHFGKPDSGLQEFSVRVWATPPGREPYLIGADTLREQSFRSNRTPQLTVGPGFDASHAYQVGCAETEGPLAISFVANDTDGSCDSIFLSNAGPNSALGKLDTVLECISNQENNVVLPLTVPNTRSANIQDGLRIRVRDDNGEYTDTTLKFRVAINQAPGFMKFERASNKMQYTNKEVAIHFVVHDTDSPISTLHVFWGDSNTANIYIGDGNNTADYTATHQYATPGFYTIYASATDTCGTTNNRLSLGSAVQVKANSNPHVTCAYSGFDLPAKAKLKLGVSDRDMEDNSDSVLISVDWYDGGPRQQVQIPCCASKDTTLIHDFGAPWNQDLKAFIEATDAHDGRDTLTQIIPRQ